MCGQLFSVHFALRDEAEAAFEKIWLETKLVKHLQQDLTHLARQLGLLAKHLPFVKLHRGVE